MSSSQLYIITSIVILAIIAAIMFLVRRPGRGQRLSPLAGLAFVCIVAGILFGESRPLGYGLLAAGVILAVIDIFIREKQS
jgi:uncharacterized membrane protein